MSGKRYTEDFKIEAVKQILERGYKLSEVAEPLGVTTKSLYDWKKEYGDMSTPYQKLSAQQKELRDLKRELRRVTEERDILKEAAFFCRGVKEKYAFMKAHQEKYRLTVMCRLLKVHRSGFYAWLKKPMSQRSKEDSRLLGLIKQFWLESGCVYGYRNIALDMKDSGETCGKNRVHRLMKKAGIQSQRGYKRHRGFRSGDESQVLRTYYLGNLQSINRINLG